MIPCFRNRAAAWKNWRSNDPYFIEEKLFPERRFLFGQSILSAIGFPTNHVHRSCSPQPAPSAWVAQWERDDFRPLARKSARPRQLYTGPTPARLRGRLDIRR